MTEHVTTLIVGGGLSGLTVAHKLRLRNKQHRLLLLEKSGATGGVIRTHRENGYITEIGPHGFLDNCQESQNILKETGLDKECVKAPLIDFVRYVYLNNKLNCIPQTPLKIAKAPLISWRQKLRVLAELRQPPLAGEPTVAKWVHHRFGPALLPFADAVFTGTYAGDYNELTMDAVMPGIRALEKEHGSLIRGLWHRLRHKNQKGEKKKVRMPAMTSFGDGMARLPGRLTEPLQQGVDLRLNCTVTAISRTENGWQVQSDQGEFTADNLVLALPINVSLQLLGQIAADIPLCRVPEAWITTVAFGFGPGSTLPPGFGYLTPEVEKRFTLGSLFSSNMFPGRAPAGHILFETLVGGRRHPERLALDDETLTRKALEDVREILNLQDQPVYSTILRSHSGIPQLERGYVKLRQFKDDLERHQPGLHICGFGWEGIGLNDMMKTASRVAEGIFSQAAGRRTTEIKGVYF